VCVLCVCCECVCVCVLCVCAVCVVCVCVCVLCVCALCVCVLCVCVLHFLLCFGGSHEVQVDLKLTRFLMDLVLLILLPRASWHHT